MPTTAQATKRTREQAKAWLEHQGMSVAEFARANGLNRMAVADALRGKTAGKRGNAHNAAVLLGMKEGVIRKHVGKGRK